MLINKGACDTVLADISLNYSFISSKIVAGHELLHAAENECPCIVYDELPVSMAGEGEWYNSQ